MVKRTVLVTGAAHGIGRGIARSFLEAGHNVMLADLAAGDGWRYRLGSADDLAATVRELAALGTRGEARATPLDVTEADSCAAAVAATVAAFGGLDVLVNNAGVVDSGRIGDYDEARWDRLFAVNVKGVFLATRAALAALRASANGAVVNVASIAGKRGAAGMAAYCGSKFAVVGITQALALELAPDGIRVNALCPGMVDTAMWRDHLFADRGRQAFAERMAELIPLGRPQTAQDMGEAALYLASAANVTGVALNVAGGYEMH